MVAKFKSCLDCFFRTLQDKCGRVMKMNYCAHTPQAYKSCEEERKNEYGCGKKGKYYKKKG